MSWRIDETYIGVGGQWCYLYRAVDKTGQIIDFLPTGQRGKWSAMRFLTKVERLMRRLLFERRRQHADAGDVEHTACAGFITGVDDPGHPFPAVQENVVPQTCTHAFLLRLGRVACVISLSTRGSRRHRSSNPARYIKQG
jgi:DDE domain